MVRRFILPLLILVSMTAAGEDVRLEQVQTNLPDLYAYFYSEAPVTEKEITASLGNRAANVESVHTYNTDTDATDYYVLVDCSTSIWSGQMNAVRSVLGTLADKLSPNDTVTLISFGVGTDVLLDRSGDTKAIREAIEKLKPDQAGTVFFDALAKAIALSEAANSDVSRRQMAFVFSDSVDVNLGGYTKGEIELMLTRSSLPFYAFGFDNGSKEALDSFGSVARMSGGIISIVSDKTLHEAFSEILEKLRSVYIVKLSLPDNIVPDEKAEFEISVDGKNLSATVPLNRWQPDNAIPTAVKVYMSTDETLIIEYSEQVLGAEKTDNYVFRDENGNLAGVKAVFYDKEAMRATVTLTEIPNVGKLFIDLSLITDNSMEKNPIAGTYELTLPEKPPLSSEPERIEEKPDEGTPAGAWVFIVCIVVAAAAGIAVYAVKRKRIVIGGEVVYADSVELERRVAENEELKVHFVSTKLPEIKLLVTMAAGQTETLTVPVNKTLFVGRSEINDIYFDDATMSRQHFVIEEEDGVYKIANISETRGTLLNGVLLAKPRPLSDGDRIEAGSITIIFFKGDNA